MYIIFTRKSCSSSYIKSTSDNLNLLIDYYLELGRHANVYCYIISDYLLGKETNELFPWSSIEYNRNKLSIRKINQDIFKNIRTSMFIIGFNRYYFEPQSIKFIASNIWNKEENFIDNGLFYLTRLLLLRYSFIHELTSIYLSSISNIVENTKINMLKYIFGECKIKNIIELLINSKGSNVYVDFSKDTSSGIMLFDFSTGVSSFSLLLDEILRGLEGCVGGSG